MGGREEQVPCYLLSTGFIFILTSRCHSLRTPRLCTGRSILHAVLCLILTTIFKYHHCSHFILTTEYLKLLLAQGHTASNRWSPGSPEDSLQGCVSP